MLWRDLFMRKLRRQSLSSCVQERPQFEGQGGLFGKLTSVRPDCQFLFLFVEYTVKQKTHINPVIYVLLSNTAEHFCQVGAYSRQIRLPPPMEAIPRTRHSLSPMCFFNGGSCFLCHHPKRVPGNRKKFQTHVVVARFVLNQT